MNKELFKMEENFKKEEKNRYKMPSLDVISDEVLKKMISNIDTSNGIIVPFGFGKNDLDEIKYFDITKMPNLLIGGTVMSGKTNFVNTLICSIIMRYSPEEVRLSVSDSKGVDFTCYNGIPHLLHPVIRNVRILEKLLSYEIKEIQERYKIFDESGFKRISDYNKNNEDSKMPYHIIFIDDYTAFVNGFENDCNKYIEYISQNGWNVGIHLIIVANHPTVKIISAITLLNFPSRVSFRVTSIKDSRMILEAPGAEKITGIGNLLVNIPTAYKIEEIHVNLIEDDVINKIVNELKTKNNVSYIDIYKSKENDVDHDDSLYNDIVEYVITAGKASASLLQRRFKLGYNKASRIIDFLEERGIIGPQNGSKPREVLVVLDNDNVDDKSSYF